MFPTIAIPRWVMYAGAIAVLMGVLTWIRLDGYSDGYDAAEKDFQKVINQERQRILKANEESIAQAQAQIENLTNTLRERNEIIRTLRLKASQDPNATNPAINDDSVRRIDSIK